MPQYMQRHRVISAENSVQPLLSSSVKSCQCTHRFPQIPACSSTGAWLLRAFPWAGPRMILSACRAVSREPRPQPGAALSPSHLHPARHASSCRDRQRFLGRLWDFRVPSWCPTSQCTCSPSVGAGPAICWVRLQQGEDWQANMV